MLFGSFQRTEKCAGWSTTLSGWRCFLGWRAVALSSLVLPEGLHELALLGREEHATRKRHVQRVENKSKSVWVAFPSRIGKRLYCS